MKVIYYSKSFFSDCDFPLVRELQEKGIDVRYYIPIAKGFKNASIIEFRKPWMKWGIYKASKMEDMQIYKDCVDLNRLYFISGYSTNPLNPMAWLLWFFVLLHFYIQRPQVLHITWQLGPFEDILLRIPFHGKKVMTVHDPIQHSGTKDDEINEKRRIKCFHWANYFILLNKQQVPLFCEKYCINKNKVMTSCLGAYNSISKIEDNTINVSVKQPYIVFFGQIAPNKGLEYLLEAMLIVHKKHPEVNLLVAGRGEMYFDIKPYKSLDYIFFENRYIGISELISFVRNSLFSVCPYKDATQSGVLQTSLALETPVVVSNVGNMPDIVKNGKYGLTVQACDAESLSNAICTLLDNTSMIDEMKKKIKNNLLPTMGWSNIADDYIKVYNW